MSSKFKYIKLPHLMLRTSSGEVTESEYLGRSSFSRIIGVAVLLHICVLYIWYLAPKTEIENVTVRVLNIKLSDIEGDVDKITFPHPSQANNTMIEHTLSEVVKDITTPNNKSVKGESTAIKKQDIVPVKSEKDYLSKLTAKPKQYVRASTNKAKTTSTVGKKRINDAKVMRRYEQLISAWIRKFKRYPEKARVNNIQGETVVRIRIDRRGNIGYYILERSTGYQILDRAAVNMIRRANPVPAVPNDYPPGDLMEFLIPVTFQLQ